MQHETEAVEAPRAMIDDSVQMALVTTGYDRLQRREDVQRKGLMGSFGGRRSIISAHLEGRNKERIGARRRARDDSAVGKVGGRLSGGKACFRREWSK